MKNKIFLYVLALLTMLELYAYFALGGVRHLTIYSFVLWIVYIVFYLYLFYNRGLRPYGTVSEIPINVLLVVSGIIFFRHVGVLYLHSFAPQFLIWLAALVASIVGSVVAVLVCVYVRD